MNDRKPRERKPVPAYARALGLLARREHSAVELRRKLGGKEVDAQELDAALEVLQRQGFQDDLRYARALVRDRAQAGQGPVRIRAELRMNGVPAPDIDAVFADLQAEGLDWQTIATRVAGRFPPALRASHPKQGQRQRHKTLAFLLRRGFPQDLACRALALREDEVEGGRCDDA